MIFHILINMLRRYRRQLQHHQNSTVPSFEKINIEPWEELNLIKDNPKHISTTNQKRNRFGIHLQLNMRQEV